MDVSGGKTPKREPSRLVTLAGDFQIIFKN